MFASGEWIYAGGRDINFWKMFSQPGNHPGPKKDELLELPPFTRNCICGHDIEKNRFIYNTKTSELKVLGITCIERFISTERVCVNCEKSHKNRNDNYCKECRDEIKAELKKKNEKHCDRCDAVHKNRKNNLCNACRDIELRAYWEEQNKISLENLRIQRELEAQEREKQYKISLVREAQERQQRMDEYLALQLKKQKDKERKKQEQEIRTIKDDKKILLENGVAKLQDYKFLSADKKIVLFEKLNKKLTEQQMIYPANATKIRQNYVEKVVNTTD